MQNTATSPATTSRFSVGLLSFLLLSALLAVLQSLFPLLAFGPGFYGALSMRLSGWALLAELAAPLLFGGLLLAVLVLLWTRLAGAQPPWPRALSVRLPGPVIFLVLTALCAVPVVFPSGHIGYGLDGPAYFAGLLLSFLWQETVPVAFVAIPVFVLLPMLERRMKPGAAAWALFGIALLTQALAMAAFRLLWQLETHPANLFLLDVLPYAIAPVLIGMIPVMLAILVNQRSKRENLWSVAFATAAASAVWALLAPQFGALLGSMGLVDSTYLVLVRLVFFVLTLLVFGIMSLTIGKKHRKVQRQRL